MLLSRRASLSLIERLQAAGIRDERVLTAMAEIPRPWFVDEALAHSAYDDCSLPIGLGQTISQPYIVARMTELLLAGERPLERVLEIGTGSGYQTAILAKLCTQVFTLERILSLQQQARSRIGRLRLSNVRFKHADGGLGWKDCAPFDAIIVTAAAAQVPPALIEQLQDGARLVVPVGEGEHQWLELYRRRGDSIDTERLEPVRFVPLISGSLI